MILFAWLRAGEAIPGARQAAEAAGGKILGPSARERKKLAVGIWCLFILIFFMFIMCVYVFLNFVLVLVTCW